MLRYSTIQYFHLLSSSDGTRHQDQCLLSASMDKTMIIWKLDNVGAVHVDQLQVWSSGEVGERVYTPRTSQQSENVSMKIYEDV